MISRLLDSHSVGSQALIAGLAQAGTGGSIVTRASERRKNGRIAAGWPNELSKRTASSAKPMAAGSSARAVRLTGPDRNNPNPAEI